MIGSAGAEPWEVAGAPRAVGALRGTLGALWAGWWQQWGRHPSVLRAVLIVIPLADFPFGLAYGYVIARRGDADAVLYVAFGVLLMTVWARGAISVSYQLSDEIWSGTLEASMVSRSPLAAIVTGKALGSLTFMAILGLGAAAGVLAVTHVRPSIPEPGLSIVAGLVALVTMLASLLVLAPFAVLAGNRSGLFNGLMAAGQVLCGFLAPVQAFPVALQVAARFLPASWAMDAVWSSLKGGDALFVIRDCSFAVAEAVAYVALTLMAFRLVERRVRMRGAGTAV